MQSSRLKFRPLLRPKISLELRLVSKRLEGVRDRPQLVFLCGGNSEKSSEKLSYRRQIIYDFLKSKEKRYYPILAESVFRHYSEENLHKVEEEISKSADTIIIVLESPSAFVELGAFSTDAFRKKLIVINDLAHKDAPSFINTGPLKRIDQDSPGHVLHYRFTGKDKDEPCPIAEIIPEVVDVLNRARRTTHSGFRNAFDPDQDQIEISSQSLLALHDIIHLFGPIDNEDLIDAYINIYPRVKKFDHLKILKGLLLSIGLLESFKSSEKLMLRSTHANTFYKYSPLIYKTVARIKLSQMRCGKLK